MRCAARGVDPTANTRRARPHPTGTMSLEAAGALASAIQAYAAAGLLFAVPFLIRGAERVDPHLAASPVTVRLLILPGVAIFWPLLAWRWITGRQAPVERTPHRRAASERNRRA